MNQYIVYIFYFVFALYVIALCAAKLYSPFWFHQPVYHMYEIYPRWCTIPYIKRLRPPSFGIFCKPEQIISFQWNSCSSEFKNIFSRHLQGYYIDADTNLYHINENEMEKRLKINAESILSGYFEFILKEPHFQKSLNTSEIFGTISSRPIDFFSLKFPSKNSRIHFIDFISVHEKYTSKNISRNLLQTHIYNHSKIDSYFQTVYLWKKEKEPSKGVIPFIQTNTYTFLLKSTPIQKMPKQYRIRCLNKHSTDLWKTIYAEITNYFTVSLLTPFIHTLEWLENERYIVYVSIYIHNKVEHIHGVYIFEDTLVSWDNDTVERKRMIRLAGSLIFRKTIIHDVDNLYFFRGFLHCMKYILHDNKQFGVIEIPKISHNEYILERWSEKYELKNVSSLYYYLYNMVFPKSPILPKNAMILV